jgi:flagellar biosynthesis component FlhA
VSAAKSGKVAADYSPAFRFRSPGLRLFSRLITSAGIRPLVRSIVERFRAQTPVLSQAEIHPRARLKTVGSI